MGLQVIPLDAQLSDSDWQPRWPLEGITGGGVGADEYSEAQPCDECAIGRDCEIPHFSAQLEGSGIQDRSNRGY